MPAPSSEITRKNGPSCKVRAGKVTAASAVRWDNAVAESLFKTLKSEMIYHANFATRQQTKVATFEYIEGCRAAGAVQSSAKAFGSGLFNALPNWVLFFYKCNSCLENPPLYCCNSRYGFTSWQTYAVAYENDVPSQTVLTYLDSLRKLNTILSLSLDH